MADLKEAKTLKQQIVVIGTCVVGLLVGGFNAVLPSIDAAEPARTETATFALG